MRACNILTMSWYFKPWSTFETGPTGERFALNDVPFSKLHLTSFQRTTSKYYRAVFHFWIFEVILLILYKKSVYYGRYVVRFLNSAHWDSSRKAVEAFDIQKDCTHWDLPDGQHHNIMKLDASARPTNGRVTILASNLKRNCIRTFLSDRSWNKSVLDHAWRFDPPDNRSWAY